MAQEAKHTISSLRKKMPFNPALYTAEELANPHISADKGYQLRTSRGELLFYYTMQEAYNAYMQRNDCIKLSFGDDHQRWIRKLVSETVSGRDRWAPAHEKKLRELHSMYSYLTDPSLRDSDGFVMRDVPEIFWIHQPVMGPNFSSIIRESVLRRQSNGPSTDDSDEDLTDRTTLDAIIEILTDKQFRERFNLMECQE